MQDGTWRFGAAAEQTMNLAYAAEGLTQIINSLFYANDPEELKRANTRAKQYHARYTTPTMRAPENMEELLWDVAGTAYGNMLQNKLFSSMGSTGVGTKAADAVLTNTGNQRLAKAIGRSVDDVMAGLPINVLQGLTVDGDTEDKIRAMAKGALYDALSGYASSRIEDIAGDAYAWLGKNKASQSRGTDLAALTDDAYFRELQRYVDEGAAETLISGGDEQYLPQTDETAQVVSKDAGEFLDKGNTIPGTDLDTSLGKEYDVFAWNSDGARARPYDVFYEHSLAGDITQHVKYADPRGRHRRLANKDIYQCLEIHPEQRAVLEEIAGHDILAHMRTGKGRYRNPSEIFEWHHPPDNMDVLELVLKSQHHDSRRRHQFLENNIGGHVRYK